MFKNNLFHYLAIEEAYSLCVRKDNWKDIAPVSENIQDWIANTNSEKVIELKNILTRQQSRIEIKKFKNKLYTIIEYI
ncbi:MAG: hypothetical protein WAR79_20210 [Melioribacteraceae bacterium]